MELFPVLVTIFFVFLVLLLLYLIITYSVYFYKKRKNTKVECNTSPTGEQITGGHLYIPRNRADTGESISNKTIKTPNKGRIIIVNDSEKQKNR
ncbi:MAG TPA: hypothetical protein PK397_06045 [Ignavibacteriaceae bacterium]|jgi:hypothetical protein|nr:hypothetical protein [Ignavibacteriaceae bacterium]